MALSSLAFQPKTSKTVAIRGGRRYRLYDIPKISPPFPNRTSLAKFILTSPVLAY